MPSDNLPPVQPHARFLREGRWSEHLVCYSVAKNVEDRRPWLSPPDHARHIIDSLGFLRSANAIRLLAFCVMPDHFHAMFFLLPSGKSVSAIMQRSCRYTARLINQSLRRSGQFWQDGFHDHRCRDVDDMDYLLGYIESNPVRAGLIDSPEEWPFSSAHPSRATMLDRDWYNEMR